MEAKGAQVDAICCEPPPFLFRLPDLRVSALLRRLQRGKAAKKHETHARPHRPGANIFSCGALWNVTPV